MFRKTYDKSITIAESVVVEWMSLNWDVIDKILSEITTNNIIILTRSTLKSHEKYLSKHFDETGVVVPRQNTYTHHSGDYFPSSNSSHPFISLLDPNLEEGYISEQHYFDSVGGELVDHTSLILLQTTTEKEGRIERFGGMVWITLPRITFVDGVQHEVKSVAEIAALALFGEARGRGFMSMLWLDFKYDEVKYLKNQHFSKIIQESLIVPFYLSPSISKRAVLMGFRYNDHSTTKPLRVSSPLKSSKSSLKRKPRIMRPPSPIKKINKEMNISKDREIDYATHNNGEDEDIKDVDESVCDVDEDDVKDDGVKENINMSDLPGSKSCSEGVVVHHQTPKNNLTSTNPSKNNLTSSLTDPLPSKEKENDEGCIGSSEGLVSDVKGDFNNNIALSLPQPISILSTSPPSPSRAKIRSLSPKRKSKPKTPKTKSRSKRKTKRNPNKIINPETKKPITIGGKVYKSLVKRGIITAD